MSIPYPDVLARFGRSCFALALIAFGVTSFIAGDFVAGRAPAWPAGVGGGAWWAYFSGAVFVIAGLAILTGRHAVRAAFVSSALVFAWALLRHLPLVAADHGLGGAWTNLGKALALSGGALGIAASIMWTSASADAREPSARHAATLNLIGRCSLGAFLLLAGIQHFLFAQFVATLVPAWIPGAMFWTYLAGVSLIAGGIGLAIPMTSRLAAALVGVMVFTWLLVLHIPRGISMNNQNEWTAVIEALAFSGIAFSLVARPRRVAGG
ncbi:MAG: DoxX [Gemmatimonadetes bacterium]|nr:DoxX [Gemmatimonadota bacterium]